MAKYKVGDRVKAIKKVDENDRIVGVCGTVVVVDEAYNTPFGVQFDEHVNGHDCGCSKFKADKYGCCWWCSEDALVALEEPKSPVNFKVKCVSTHDATQFTVGNIYEVTDRGLNCNGKGYYTLWMQPDGKNTFDRLVEWFRSKHHFNKAHFELVEDDTPIPVPTPTPVNVNITVNIDNYANACWYCRKDGIVDLYLAGRPGICPNCRRVCNNA